MSPLIKVQGMGFTSTYTKTLVQNKKVVYETGHDQSLSISVACKDNTSTTTTSKQTALDSPLCSNVGSKCKENGTSPEVRGRKYQIVLPETILFLIYLTCKSLHLCLLVRFLV